MSEPVPVTSPVNLINGGKKIPIIALTRQFPVEAAVISKLHHSVEPNRVGNKDNRSPVNNERLYKISSDIAEANRDFKAIFEMFPDIELAAQILVSSVMSPNDMLSSEVIFTTSNNILTPEITSSLIELVKEKDKEDFKSSTTLPQVLYKVLFETGSYILVILPENSIDELINDTGGISVESLNPLFENIDGKMKIKNIGYLGSDEDTTNETKLSIEHILNYTPSSEINSSIYKDDKQLADILTVTDNANILKLPQVEAAVRSKKTSSLINNNLRKPNSIGLESHDLHTKRFNLDEVRSLIYKRANTHQQDFRTVKTQDELERNTIGKPLVIHPPSESVITVHVPGDETDHIGYFLMIDGNGNFVDINSSTGVLTDLKRRLNDKQPMYSYLTKKASEIYGTNCDALDIDDAAKVATDIVEASLARRLKNGALGQEFKIARPELFYRILLARNFANKRTQLLFVPVELCTYIAHKYSSNGIGKSLMEDARPLNSMRAVTEMGRVMASMKNSIGRTNIELKFDENDVDPQKTMEQVYDLYSKSRSSYTPWGALNMTDITDLLARAGMQFTFTGHPRIPDMQIQTTEVNSNYAKPDTELADELKKRSIQATGLQPEVVDTASGAQFATSVAQNDLRTAKQVMQIQMSITPKWTDSIRKRLINDGDFFDKANKILKIKITELKDYYQKLAQASENQTNNPIELDDNEIIKLAIKEFINSLEVKLPEPDLSSIKQQTQQLQDYIAFLDVALEWFINGDLLNNQIFGQMSENVDLIKNLFKSYLIRDFMAKNNILPELNKIAMVTETGDPEIDMANFCKDYALNLSKNILNLFKVLQPVRKAISSDLEKVTNGDVASGTGTPSESTPPSDTDDTGDTGATGGDDNTGTPPGDNTGDDNFGSI